MRDLGGQGYWRFLSESHVDHQGDVCGSSTGMRTRRGMMMGILYNINTNYWAHTVVVPGSHRTVQFWHATRFPHWCLAKALHTTLLPKDSHELSHQRIGHKCGDDARNEGLTFCHPIFRVPPHCLFGFCFAFAGKSWQCHYQTPTSESISTSQNHSEQ